MRHIVKKIIGMITVAAAAVLFCLATGYLNKAQSLGNVMSGALSLTESISLTAIIDAFAALLAFVGIKLAALQKKSVGLLMIAASLVCLSFGILNYLDAPPTDGTNETDKIPVNVILHIIVASISGIVLLSGIWMIRRKDEKI